MTHVIMKNVEPRRALAAAPLSPMKSEVEALVADEADDILEKISGAPLPKASSVTPASDSEMPVMRVSLSSEGDRYSSAVSPRR